MMPAEPLPSSPVVSNDPTNTNGVNKVAVYYEGSGEINITVRMSETLADEINTTPIAQWDFQQILAIDDGFRCNIKAEEITEPLLLVAHYQGGELIAADTKNATYDSPRGRYVCNVDSITENIEECVVYLWDKVTMRPLSKPIRVRMSDMTVIE